MRSVEITIRGRVQGVGFRYYTLKVAGELHITGYIRNKPDGSVFIEAEGEKQNIESFLMCCRQGPPRAHVEEMQVIDCPPAGYLKFDIR
ncbi:MAG TPA: acylphosphatase [Bacteroidales bacterium]|nr:acylphosphatase [Bacteroidales bacterium]